MSAPRPPGGLPEGVLAETTAPHEWARFLAGDPEAWEEARARARGGPRVLIATSTGGHNLVTVFEGLLGIALTLRGAEVSYLLCDQAAPVCLRANVHAYPDEEIAEHGLARKLCESCWTDGSRTLGGLGLPLLRQSKLVTADETRRSRSLADEVPLSGIPAFELDGLAVGEHARAGAIRYFARADLDGEPLGERVLRRYLESALLGAFAMRRALGEGGFRTILSNHGLYVPFGIFGEVARSMQRGVVNWCVSYRRLTFIFSHGDTYHHTLLAEPTADWSDMPWDEERDSLVGEYLASRWHGTRDWIYFHEEPELEFDATARELGIDLERPIVGVLTNVVWDAQLHYPTNAFGGIVPWLVETVRYFGDRPELQAVIRVHPAEIRGTLPSRQRVMDELERHCETLPPNVFVIPPEHPVSTYAVLERCNAAVIYGTKMGVELTAIGIPVIVAGEAWIRNKGLTLDARDVDHYRELLDRLPMPARLPEEQRERARRYAYHYFFRRMIPVHSVLEEVKGSPLIGVRAGGVADLMPGCDPGLDTICRGVLEGTPFVYDGPVTEPDSA